MSGKSDRKTRPLDDIGGEPLEDSGFEGEAPEWGFAIPPGPEDPALGVLMREERRNVH